MDNETREQIDFIMNTCAGHPDKRQIFLLEKLLILAGKPYAFSFWEELRPVFGGEEPRDPESIDWETFPFLIEAGDPIAPGLSQISVCFDTDGAEKDGEKLLELLDMTGHENGREVKAEDGVLYKALTAEACMEIMEKFFEEHYVKPTLPTPEERALIDAEEELEFAEAKMAMGDIADTLGIGRQAFRDKLGE